MKTLLRDIEMAYDDMGGTRVPLLLIHGFPLDRTLWSAQLNGLANVARVIAPDLRGCGQTTHGNRDATMDTFADDLNGLLDALSIPSAIIAGLSMGGYIAFAFYRKYAHRVRALILADTRANPDSPEMKKVRDDNVAVVRDQGVAVIAERMLPRMLTPQTIAERPAVADAARAMMARQPGAGVIAALRALRDRPDSTPTLAQINVPTLVLVGADDALTPPQDAEAMRTAIRGAKLTTIPNAAHLANFEQPEIFNRAVREFLQALA